MCFKKQKKPTKEPDNVSYDLEYIKNSALRDGHYTELLKIYVDNNRQSNKQQLKFKCWFFIIVCVVFVGVISLGALGIYKIASKPNIVWEDIGVALTGLGSILGVIIVLPSKIADNLFPASGPKQSTKFIRLMQKYDLIPFESDEEEDIPFESDEEEDITSETEE